MRRQFSCPISLPEADPVSWIGLEPIRRAHHFSNETNLSAVRAARPSAQRARRSGGRRRRSVPPRTGTVRCGAAAGCRPSGRGSIPGTARESGFLRWGCPGAPLRFHFRFSQRYEAPRPPRPEPGDPWRASPTWLPATTFSLPLMTRTHPKCRPCSMTVTVKASVCGVDAYSSASLKVSVSAAPSTVADANSDGVMSGSVAAASAPYHCSSGPSSWPRSRSSRRAGAASLSPPPSRCSSGRSPWSRNGRLSRSAREADRSGQREVVARGDGFLLRGHVCGLFCCLKSNP